MIIILKMRLPIQPFLILTLLAGAVLLSACRPVVVVEGQPQPTLIEVVPTPEPTQEAIATSIPAPAGDEENPLVMAIVDENEDPSLEEAAAGLAAQLSESTGLNIQAQMFTTYNEVLEGLVKGDVQMAWLPPLTYVQANRLGAASAALLTNHLNVYSYGTEFFANSDSGFDVYFDPNTNTSTEDAASALDQFSGKRPCFTEPSSISGYIVPEGLLLKNEVDFLPPVEAQTYSSVLRSLYAGGICDFGATYSTSGDPLTASDLNDLPDLPDKVVIVWQSDAIIPNLNFSFLPTLDLNVRAQITQALLTISEDEVGQQMISDATNYEIQELKKIDDSFYDPLRELVELVKPDPKLVIGK